MKCSYFGNKKCSKRKIIINVRIKGKHIPGRARPRYQEVHHRVLARQECWQDKMYVQPWLLKDWQNVEKLKHAQARRQEQHIALCTLYGLDPKLTLSHTHTHTHTHKGDERHSWTHLLELCKLCCWSCWCIWGWGRYPGKAFGWPVELGLAEPELAGAGLL